MEHPSFKELIAGYFSDRLTREELDLLLENIRNGQISVEDWDDSLVDAFAGSSLPNSDGELDKKIVFGRLLTKMDVAPASARVVPLRRRGWWRMAAAVVLLAVTVTGGIWLLNKKKTVMVAQDTPIAPGGNHAVLTLADGSTVWLEEAGNGNIAKQAGVNVVKSDSNLLVYTGSGAPDVSSMNTLSTPKGGQFQLMLPDGTRVWLNAASSIRYPVVFNGKERAVTLTGEAYFEVAKNEKMPFTVSARGMKLEVLGTHFNVMAYEEEADISTTLTEGRVRLSANNREIVMQPGTKASFTAGDFQVTPAEEAHELAWKNGRFSFNRADIHSIMRQISRWYDVEVEYSGDVAEKSLVGEIERNVPLSKVLRILQLSGVECKVEGKKITVLK